MAAGLGYKEFTTGEVLTAAAANGYLASQVVMVFADAAARTTAITSPQEGMLSYLKDTNAVEAYDGSAWISVGSTGDITGVTAGTGISGGGTSGTVTVTNSMATAIDAKGDLIAGTGADTFSRLAIGTDNQVLTADSTAATGMKWATASGGGGGMTLLSTTSLSGSTTTISSISQSYKDLVILIRNFRPTSDGSDLYMRLNADSTANRHAWWYYTTEYTAKSFDSSEGRCAPATDNTTSYSLGVFTIKDYTNTATWKLAEGWTIANNQTTATNYNWQTNFIAYNQTGAISSLAFLPGTSTIAGGEVLLYGVN